VSVRDTGIGIAAEHLAHIFEMFSQVAPALERSQGGLGIGLALVRGLVELHGGKVEARSAGPGKGSEFIVRLPVLGTPIQPSQEPSRAGAQSPAGTRRRILVVDDNRDAVDSLALMFQLRGHDIEIAHDGLEAVQAAATFRPDVVLLDIGLPRMNGYEAARHIREQPWGKSMVLIALTGWGQEEDKRRALEAGFNHHLTKPVEAAALEDLLAHLTPLSQQAAAARQPK
jgi:CheY-like chemotaxis protein